MSILENRCLYCNCIIPLKNKFNKNIKFCSKSHKGSYYSKKCRAEKNKIVNNKCIDCNKNIDFKSLRCTVCSKKGELSNIWKGDSVSNGQLHQWIRRNKPKIDYCEICKTEKSFDLANISGEYKRNINDFRWLCRKCHMESDGRLFSWYKNGNKVRWKEKKTKHL